MFLQSVTPLIHVSLLQFVTPVRQVSVFALSDLCVVSGCVAPCEPCEVVS